MFKLYAVHGEKKPENGNAALPKGKTKPSTKKAQKWKSAEKEVEDNSNVPAKSTQKISNEAPLGEEQTDPPKAQQAKASEEEIAAHVPRRLLVTDKTKLTGAQWDEKNTGAKRTSAIPLVSEKAAANEERGGLQAEENRKDPRRANKASFRQSFCEANTDSQNPKRVTSSEDEKAAYVPRSPSVLEKEKVIGALQEEKQTGTQRASAMPLFAEKPATNAAQEAPRAAENTVKAHDLEKPLNIPSYLRQPFSEARDGKKAQKGRAPYVSSFPMRSAKKKAEGASPQDENPAAKRSKTGKSIVALVNASDPRSFVRRRISKDFDGTLYFGTIMEYDDTENPPYWHVAYDDGDEEDYSKKDLIGALKHYETEGKKDTMI